MIKYYTLSLSLFISYNLQSNEGKSYINNILYKGNNSLEGIIESSNVNDYKDTDDSCYMYCIIYLIVTLIVIFSLIYYCYRQLRKKRQLVQNKDNIIKRMKENIENINEMIEICKISNEEILRIYRLMVQLSVSPQKDRHQKFLLDYNRFIYNSDNAFLFDWKSFEILLNKISNLYVDKLRTLYPNLSDKEVQVVAMQKAGFEISDIAEILEYSVNTVYKRNSDIRKKLEVPELGNIIHFIDQKLEGNS